MKLIRRQRLPKYSNCLSQSLLSDVKKKMLSPVFAWRIAGKKYHFVNLLTAFGPIPKIWISNDKIRPENVGFVNQC